MERRQRQITNELVLEGQNANKIALFFSNGNPEEVEIGNRTNHVLWGMPRLGVSQLFEIISHRLERARIEHKGGQTASYFAVPVLECATADKGNILAYAVTVSFGFDIDMWRPGT